MCHAAPLATWHVRVEIPKPVQWSQSSNSLMVFLLVIASPNHQVLQKENCQLTPHVLIWFKAVRAACVRATAPSRLRQTHGAPWHETTCHGISKSLHAAAEGMRLPGGRAGTTRTQILINGREMPFAFTKPPLEAATGDTLTNAGTQVWDSRWGTGSQMNKLCTLDVELDGSTVGSLLFFSAPRQVFVPWLFYRQTNLLLLRQKFMMEIKALRAFIFHHYSKWLSRTNGWFSSTYQKVNSAVRRTG